MLIKHSPKVSLNRGSIHSTQNATVHLLIVSHPVNIVRLHVSWISEHIVAYNASKRCYITVSHLHWYQQLHIWNLHTGITTIHTYHLLTSICDCLSIVCTKTESNLIATVYRYTRYLFIYPQMLNVNWSAFMEGPQNHDWNNGTSGGH